MKIGTPGLRRKIGELLPWGELHKMIALVDIMDATSRQIYKQKKEALAQGDDAVLQEVGMGKDIMSVLREFLCLEYGPFLESFPCH